MLRQKRAEGYVYSVITVVATIIILSMAAFYFNDKYSDLSSTKGIGEKQFELFDAYQVAENALYFIDQSAKYSLMQSIYDLARNGGFANKQSDDGFAEGSDCGTYAGYSLWNAKINNKKCFPYDITDEFKKSINNYINRYIFYYRYLDIPKNNYEITIKQVDDVFTIIGNAKQTTKTSKRVHTDIYSVEEKKSIQGKCDKLDLVEIPDTIRCAKDKCLVVSDIIPKLDDAAKIARKKGVKLMITSAYRSYEYQKELFDKYGQDTSRVSNPTCESPHVTGRAVDIFIVDGKSMKTTSPSNMDLGDRKLLENIMCKAGFVRYKNEFWHYEYGTKRWQRGTDSGKCSA